MSAAVYSWVIASWTHFLAALSASLASHVATIARWLSFRSPRWLLTAVDLDRSRSGEDDGGRGRSALF
jgi:hypothetical protein